MTAIVVVAHPGVNEIIHLHEPFWRKTGLPIIGVDHVGGGCTWANGNPFALQIGGPPDSKKHRWVDRFLEIINWCTVHTNYDDFLITEYDGVIVRKPPAHPGGIVGTLAGHKSDGFLAKSFYHCPWWMDRPSAEDFLRRARIMLDFNLSEHGFIDRFLGAYGELYGVPIQQMNTYSRNTIESPEEIEDARKAVAENCWFIHGIKSKEVLDAITKNLSCAS